MTTVAYKDGVMVCDTCWTEGGVHTVSANKIARLRSGALLGQAGQNDARHIIKLLDNVMLPEQLPLYTDLVHERTDFAGLLVLPNRQVFKINTIFYDFLQDKDCDHDCGAWEVPDRVAAIGSGGDLALAVMLYGGSAWDAVKIACKLDINSRQPLVKMLLHEPKEKPNGDRKPAVS